MGTVNTTSSDSLKSSMPQKYTIQRQKKEGPSHSAVRSNEILMGTHPVFVSRLQLLNLLRKKSYLVCAKIREQKYNMKNSLALFTVLLSLQVASQARLNSWMDSAKAEFKKEFEAQDYSRSKLYLDSVLALQPDHVEAHYYLGYTYSRLNAKDGAQMYETLRSGTERCSAEFETVIRLQSHYEGEIVVLDPYCKITSEWGSLASAYERKNQIDSARWAYAQGKKRGGFSDFFLALGRQTLDACKKNAILITSGDMYTFPLWYLQRMENYRKDIALVDISLINAKWYPAFLQEKKVVDFGLPPTTLDTIDYCQWESQWVKAGALNWKLPAMYYENYLLRGDRLVLSLLRQNAFKRAVYFTVAFPPESQLNLKDHLWQGILVDQLRPEKGETLPPALFQQRLKSLMNLISLINRNSDDERRTFDNFRYDVFIRAAEYRETKASSDRRLLVELYESLAADKFLPFLTKEGKTYEEEMLREE